MFEVIDRVIEKATPWILAFAVLYIGGHVVASILTH